MSRWPIETEIINTLNKRMKIYSLRIVNESFMHNVPKDSESHFKIVIVSNEFSNLSLLARHKIVYKNLDVLMKKFMPYQYMLLMKKSTNHNQLSLNHLNALTKNEKSNI